VTRTLDNPGHALTSWGQPALMRTAADELLAVLEQIHGLLAGLLHLANDKLAAMRRADTARLDEVARQECALLERFYETQRTRDAIVARWAQSLPVPSDASAAFADVVAALPEPERSRLQAKTAGLRRIAAELQEKNRLAASVARSLHSHIRSVFEEIARHGQESGVYGPNGQTSPVVSESWVDAVG